MSEKRCYTVKELQAMLGVSRPSVYELLKKNVFRSFIVGGKHIISKSSFDEWLDGDSISFQKAVSMSGLTEILRQKKEAGKSWTSDFKTCIIKVI